MQESILRVVVAVLVAPGRRATAYGVFAAVVGVAAFAGGALTGVLHDTSIPVLIAVVAAIRAAAVPLPAVTGFKVRHKSEAGQRACNVCQLSPNAGRGAPIRDARGPDSAARLGGRRELRIGFAPCCASSMSVRAFLSLR
ncbi:hypothetical protein ACFVDQ_22445 [Streptomyces sp. NPDC057684]|uniref:hypothetical protein n=1 Tax=Streptomyces sp. NPDC057684 TaxID=3346211 RepID=UPI0036CC32E0